MNGARIWRLIGRLINSNNKGLVIKKHKCISKIIRCK